MFGAYLVLARLVSPTDFGLYAAATVITGIGGLFAESGMMAALITRHDRMEEAASTAFAAMLVGGLLLTLCALAASPLLGLFFGSGRVQALAAVLSGWLFLYALTVVPDALLQRRFSFARRMVVDPLGALAFATVSIVACANGAGPWGLVAGVYASITVQVIAGWWFARLRPRFRLASVSMWRELARVARPVLAAEVFRRIAAQIDAVMLGGFVGAAPLGQYRNGLRIAQQSPNAFVDVGAYVLLPTFARLGRDSSRLGAAAQRVFGLVGAVALPASAAAVPLGVPIAVLALGARWRPAGHALAGLCGLLLGSAIVSVASELFKAVGRPELLVRVHVLGLVSMAVLVISAAVPFGLLGVAIAVSASQCLTAAYAFHRVGPLIGLGWRDLVRDFAGPTVATAVMLLSMLAFTAAVDPLGNGYALALTLTLAEAALGALVYLIALLVVDRQRRGDMRGSLEAMRARRASAAV